MSNPIELWENPEVGLSKSQIVRAGKLREWLRASDIPISLALADPGARDPCITCTGNAMQKLERRLFEESGSLSAAHLDCQILGKIVAYLNSKGSKIHQPRLSYLFTLPINPFGDGVAVPLQLVRKWLEVEDLWITECSGSNPLELVVLSAVLQGGLLHTSNIVSFVRALFAPEKALGYVAKRVYVDLTLPWRGMPDMERRNWQPDDQTASMICPTKEFLALEQLFGPKWKGGNLDLLSDSQLAGRLFTKIMERMRRSKVEKGLRPESFNQLLKLVAICAQMEVPAVLVEYASRGLISHSLKPHVLRRIYNQPPDSRHQEEESDPSINLEAKEISDLSDDQEDIEPDGLKDLRTALRTKIPKIARARLENIVAARINGAKENLPENATPHEPPTPRSVWFLISDFALSMLTRRQVLKFGVYHRKLLQLSSVQKYALIVGRRLGRQLGDEDLLTFTPLNIETAYTKVLERVLEQSTSSARLLRTVANALREFQNYLELERGVPQIDREVLGVEGGLLPVDSNIVTLEEYQRALQHIRDLGDERIFGAAEAMLILGFRCGTRRMEAHGMKVEDLIDRGSAWLILRPSEERRLKTPSATRQLPLQALVPHKELQVLLKWKRSREIEGASDSSYMFCEVDGNGHEEVIHIDRLMPIIHEALRDATTDKSMHYHHLRHSCATWMFLRLMLSDLPRIPDLFPHLESTTAWLKKSRSFRIMLYGRGSPTRQHALAVASLLGHSGHRVTMENYVHCLDWLLPVFLEQSDLLRVTSTARLVTASSFDQSTIYLWEQRRRGDVPVEMIEKSNEVTTSELPAERLQAKDTENSERERDWGRAGAPVELFKRRFPGLAASFETRISEPAVASWAVSAWKSLRWPPSGTFSSISEDLDLDLNEIRTRAEKVQRIIEPRGRKTPRHEMESVPDEKLPGQTRKIACPKLPDNLGMFQELENRLKSRAHLYPINAKKVFGYYVNNIWPKRTLLPFKNPEHIEDAVRYLNFLRSLEIKDEDILLGSFHELDRSNWRNTWKQKLEEELQHRFKIEKLHWSATRDAKESSESIAKMLVIEPKFDLDGSGQKLGGSEGFRFLMTMAAIVFGYEGEEG